MFDIYVHYAFEMVWLGVCIRCGVFSQHLLQSRAIEPPICHLPTVFLVTIEISAIISTSVIREIMSSHHKRRHYSLQTKTLLEDIMKSIKLPTQRRKVIEKHVRNGDPMPIFRESTTPTTKFNADRCPRQCKSAKTKKRTQTAIVEQGDYDIEKFTPIKNPVDREEEKRKLQDIFSGIETIPETTSDTETDNERLKKHTKSFTFSKNERVKELMEQVQERIEFLQIMRQLGCARKYEFDVTLEISQKLARLRSLSEQ